MRMMRTDKNEMTRGKRSLDEHPVKPKSRGVLPGYKDKQLLKGELITDSPTMTAEATAVLLQEAASHPNWLLELGDVDSAFLNGRYLGDDRRVFFKAPKGGLPAVPELGWEAVPEGTILRAKKGVYGLNDAPLMWYMEHRDAIMSLPGAHRSKLCPALFYFTDENGKLIGLIGIHVDDDLLTGTPEFFKNQAAKLQKMHCYGKWNKANLPGEKIVHCGKTIVRQQDMTLAIDQKEYVDGMTRIPLTKERRADKEALATAKEREQLRSGNGKVSWLVRSTRMDLAFKLVESQTRALDPELKVKDLIAFNSLVTYAKSEVVRIYLQNIDLDKATVLAIGDSSFANAGKLKTASQAGLVIMLADNADGKLESGEKVKVSPLIWRSHRIKRVVRSTLAAESMAALEAIEGADLIRANFV